MATEESMTTFENAEAIHGRLQDIAETLELEEAEPLDLLVCGAASGAYSRDS
jgi:hypothetical protein